MTIPFSAHSTIEWEASPYPLIQTSSRESRVAFRCAGEEPGGVRVERRHLVQRMQLGRLAADRSGRDQILEGLDRIEHEQLRQPRRVGGGVAPVAAVPGPVAARANAVAVRRPCPQRDVADLPLAFDDAGLGAAATDSRSSSTSS